MWYIHQNCNFGRGNDNRPLQVRGNYLLSDTAMMVISHAYVVREYLWVLDHWRPKPNKLRCWVSLIQMKLQGAPPQVFGTSLDLCSLWMFHIYCTRFTICLVFLWNVQSVFVRHAAAISAACFLWKSVFFRRLASRLFLLQCCGVLGRLTCSSAIPWVLR